MALNPNTIKALFGKLAPYADDVAGAVASYGDDAARAVANYGDDVADAIKIGTNPSARKAIQDVNTNTVFDMFEQPITSVDGVKINDRWFSHPGIELNKQYHDFMYDMYWDSFDGPFEDYVGNDTKITKAAMLDRIAKGARSYDAPVSLNVDKRPGANTALGRWYRKNHPGEYPYAIGPNQHLDWDILDNPFIAVSTHGRLPF